MKGLNLVFTEL